MTSSQWLDIAVLAVAFIAAISGWRSGAIGSLLSFVGVLLGAIAGVLLAPHLVAHIAAPRAKLFAALFLILALVVVGEVAGVVLGRAVRGAIHSNTVRFFDSLIGVAVQLVVVLVAAWLLATPLTSSAGQPNLAAAVRGSRVLGKVNDYAPEWLKTVPKRLSSLLDTSGLPQVLEPFSRTPVVAVAAPDSALANNPVVANTEPSVVKIRAIAPGCQKVLEGSGFVLSPDRVMTNAHVVAGADSVTVEASGNPHDATVVSYDPTVDIAILSVPNLPAGPLAFADAALPAKSGTEAIVMGYPGGGGFNATPARIREEITLNGPDIYKNATINRDVYTVRANVEQGNSGGPLIDLDGQVLGVVFGAAVDDNDTGFVLTAKEVSAQLAHVHRGLCQLTGDLYTRSRNRDR
jgi:S1-C subfamily serine protease